MNSANTDEQTQNCWEIVDCPPDVRMKCRVYHLQGGQDCWFFNDVGVGGPRIKAHIGCLDCPIYKKKLDFYSKLKKPKEVQVK